MSTESDNPSPATTQLCMKIDSVFTRYVGPISSDICAEEARHWRQQGQARRATIHRYILRLSKHIDGDKRRAFITAAYDCLVDPHAK